MKSLIFILALMLGSGCASTNSSTPAVVPALPVITVDPAALENEQTGAVYLAYSIAKSIWEPAYLKDGSPDFFAREVYARSMMLQIWKEGIADKAHPVLDKMTSVSDAGYLRELIWVQYNDAFNTTPIGLDIRGFEQWLAKNPDAQIALSIE